MNLNPLDALPNSLDFFHYLLFTLLLQPLGFLHVEPPLLGHPLAFAPCFLSCHPCFFTLLSLQKHFFKLVPVVHASNPGNLGG
jgi:hypothetical protein